MHKLYKDLHEIESPIHCIFSRTKELIGDILETLPLHPSGSVVLTLSSNAEVIAAELIHRNWNCISRFILTNGCVLSDGKLMGQGGKHIANIYIFSKSKQPWLNPNALRTTNNYMPASVWFMNNNYRKKLIKYTCPPNVCSLCGKFWEQGKNKIWLSCKHNKNQQGIVFDIDGDVDVAKDVILTNRYYISIGDFNDQLLNFEKEIINGKTQIESID